MNFPDSYALRSYLGWTHVLCADKSDAVVKYTLPENETQVFASKYKLYLPTEEELKKESAK